MTDAKEKVRIAKERKVLAEIRAKKHEEWLLRKAERDARALEKKQIADERRAKREAERAEREAAAK